MSKTKEAVLLDFHNPTYSKHPLTEREQSQRLLNALKPGTEREQTRDLREVMESITRELLGLERANPDSRSLSAAAQHAECLLGHLKAREAALDHHVAPF
ncbi:MAG: hypothetical protein NVS3B25_33530 [Hymenobacter sp.]